MAKDNRTLVYRVEFDSKGALKTLDDYNTKLQELDKNIMKNNESMAKGEKSAKELSDNYKLLTEKSEHMKSKLDSLYKAREELLESQEEGSEMTKEEARALRDLDKEIEKVNRQFNRNVNEIQKSSQEFDKLTHEIKQTTDEATDLTGELDKTADKAKEVSQTRMQAFKQELETLKKEAEWVTEGFDKMKQSAQEFIAVATVIGGISLSESMGYETEAVNILRLAQGTDEQKATLKESIQELYYSRPEDMDEFFSGIEPILAYVDPDEYGEKFQGIVNLALDFAKAANMGASEVAEYMKTLDALYDPDTVKDWAGLLSISNALQNEFYSDTDRLLNSSGRAIAVGGNAGFSYAEMMGFIAPLTNASAMEDSGLGSNVGEFFKLFGQGNYNVEGEGNELVYDAIYNGMMDGAVDAAEKEFKERGFSQLDAIQDQMDTQYKMEKEQIEKENRLRKEANKEIKAYDNAVNKGLPKGAIKQDSGQYEMLKAEKQTLSRADKHAIESSDMAYIDGMLISKSDYIAMRVSEQEAIARQVASTMDLGQLLDMKDTDYDSYKKLVKDMNIDPERWKQIESGYAMQKDLMEYTKKLGYGDFATVQDLQKWMTENQGLAATALLDGIKNEAKEKGMELAELTGQKEYLTNGRGLNDVISTAVTILPQIQQGMGIAAQAQQDGTAVEEEVSAIRDTFEYQIDLRKKEVMESFKILGDELQPFILEVIEGLMPLADQIEEFAQWLSTQDPEFWGKAVASLIKVLVELFKIRMVGRFGIGALQTLIGLKQLFGGINGFLGAVTGAGASGATIASGTKGLGLLSKALTGLSSPVGVAVGAIGLLTGAIVGIEKYNKHLKEMDPYKGLDPEQQQIAMEANESRYADATLNMSVRLDGQLKLSDKEIKSIEDTMQTQLDQALAEKEERISQLGFTTTGNEEIDNAMREELLKQQTTLNEKTNRMTEIQAEISTATEELATLSGEAYTQQLKNIQNLKKEFEVLWAEVMAEDTTDQQRLYQSINNADTYETASVDDKNARLKELSELNNEALNTYNNSVKTAGKRFGYNSAEFKEFEKAQKRALEELQKGFYVEAHGIYNNSSFLDKFRLNDAFDSFKDGTSVFSEEDLKAIYDITDFTNKIANNSLALFDEEDREMVAKLMEIYDGNTNVDPDNEFVKEYGTYALVLDQIKRQGVESIETLKKVMGSEFDEDFERGMVDALIKYTDGLDEATMTINQKQMELYTLIYNRDLNDYLNNYDSEAILTFLKEQNLFGDEEVIEVVTKMTLDGSSSQEIIDYVAFMSSTLNEQLKLTATVKTDDAQQSLVNLVHYFNEVMRYLNDVRPTIKSMLPTNVQTIGGVVGKAFSSIMPYATGTGLSGHNGGLALVGDGRQREVILSPDYTQAYATPSTNTLINLPEGWHVIPSMEQFMRMLKGSIPKYATGTPLQPIQTSQGANITVPINIQGVPDSVGLSKDLETMTQRVVEKHYQKIRRREKSIGQ